MTIQPTPQPAPLPKLPGLVAACFILASCLFWLVLLGAAIFRDFM